MNNIHRAVETGDLTAVKSLLDQYPSLVFCQDAEFGLTPLHLTATHDHKDVAEFLISRKADINAKDHSGKTPLHLATKHNRKRIVELLMAHNADVNARDACGKTPLDLATGAGDRVLIELLSPLRLFKTEMEAVSARGNDVANKLEPGVNVFDSGAFYRLEKAGARSSYDRGWRFFVDKDRHVFVDGAREFIEVRNESKISGPPVGVIGSQDGQEPAKAARDRHEQVTEKPSWQCQFAGCSTRAEAGEYCYRHADFKKRLARDRDFAVRTVASKGRNLDDWLPSDPRVFEAAIIEARAVLARSADIKERESDHDVEFVSKRLLKEQYELLAEVGRGGFGTVYKARDVHLDQFVAVKELILEDPAPLKDEAKVLSDLRHRNIVGFRQLFPDRGRWYLVMDFVEGGNLAKLIRTSALYHRGGEEALKRMLFIAQQAAEGLACAHEFGVIHQDVKPANVMVDLKGVAKVSDFGLAKARPQGVMPLSMGGMESIMLSVNGMTPAFCSPEQANGRKLTRKTDTWSWGLSVLEMFIGEVTWTSGRAARQALQAYLATQARRKDIPPLPQRLTNLLERCFQEEPPSRPDMGEIVASLAEIQGAGGEKWFKRFLK